MNLSEIRVKLLPRKTDKLRAFASVTIDDCVVVRDIKIIEGGKGLFVAMPSRKLCDRCPSCGGKNHLRARYCNDCSQSLAQNRAGKDERGRAKLYTDIAHPINAQARQRIEERILHAFREELERSKLPGYKPPKLGADYDDDDFRSPPRRRRRREEVKTEEVEGDYAE